MRIAILDDSYEDAKQLEDYLYQFQKEKNVSFQIEIFHSSFDFLEEYGESFDLLFLDIEMPGSNGLEVAREIREKDQTVGIIFVTNMSQYAIEGYEVNALDFVVKPVRYYSFSQKLEKAMHLMKLRKETNLVINTRDGLRRVRTSEVEYIEKEKDFLVYHLPQEELKERGSIKSVKEKLTAQSFSECNGGYLVNLSNVKRIGKDTITLLSDRELPMSRRLKKQFTEDFIRYMGGM